MKTKIMTIATVLMLASPGARADRDVDGGSAGGGGGTLMIGPDGVKRPIYWGVPVEIQAASATWACWTTFRDFRTATMFCPTGSLASPVRMNPRNGWTCDCTSYQDPRRSSNSP